MRLLRLELQRLPGIGTGFEIEDLAAGVNVVLGPNTSGKSSLARAFLALLQPGGEGNAASLAAELTDRAGPLRVERRHEPRARWTRQGEAIEPPLLLEPELLAGLVIQGEDLAAAESASGLGAGLALRIEKELAGGFDLGRARALESLKLKQHVGRSEQRALSDARDALRRVEESHRELRERETSLEELRARCDAARSAQSEVERVGRALELCECRGAAREAEARLAAFPQELARISGDTLEQLRTIEERLTEAREQRREAQEDAAGARDALEQAALAGIEVRKDDVEELTERLAELRATAQALREARTGEDGAARHLAGVQHALGSQRAEARLAITAGEVEEALAALEALAPLRADREAVTQRIDGLVETRPAPEELRALQRALEALDDWLQAPREEGWRRDDRAWGLLALLGLAGVLLLVVAESPLLRGAAGLLVGLGAWLRLRARSAAGGDAAERARSAFEAARLEPPAAWERAPARARREQLALELAAGERRCAEHEQRLECVRRRERLDGEIEARVGALEPLCRRLGFDPRRMSESRLRWLDLLRQHDDALARLADAEAARERLEEDCEAQGASLAAALARFSDLSPAERDPHALGTALRDLGRRVELRDGAQIRLEAALRDLRGTDGRIGGAEAEWSRLHEQAGVAPGDRAELERRVQLAPDYKATDQQVREMRAHAGRLAESLRERPDLLARVEADDEQSLTELRDRLAGQARELAELAAAIGGIERELELARAGHSLEDALAGVQRAERALAERAQEQLLAAAGQLWLDRVEARHRRERTGALKRAERWFARFTHDTFELDVRPGKELQLRARDVLANEPRTLEQLSTATRVQLLLAVRLAFLEEAERGREPLPLFLDEVLSTSDPERSTKIIDAVAELARAGRQIFYLTAQPDEAARWVAALGAEVRVHDLAAIRCLTGAASPGELAPAPRRRVPAPEGLTPPAYAELLGVPALDPWQEDAAHLYHLLGDRLELLHRLLDARYAHLGPLEGLLADPRAALLFDPDEIEELRCRAAVTRALLAAWREGRGRPLDLSQLAQHDALAGSTLREQVLALAEDCGLDAARLVEGLASKRVPGFRKSKREELHDWLLEAGHMTRASTLPTAELRLRALAATEPFASHLRPLAPLLAEALLPRLELRAPKAPAPAGVPAQSGL